MGLQILDRNTKIPLISLSANRELPEDFLHRLLISYFTFSNDINLVIG